ncbi:replication-associated recombination protein A [Corynebacterium guangdongense]|uniref:ATPase n=1 Tax=Corynebacterium guangdongense TaxID=1783348 RepID=A0ABU1ZWX6_9CORY|nr:replication-associated recombination protein A [Corynebacterium guangdongense]MDR7329439.1 putative ATPase [Corynebacterium guangdongense]WJZ18004.1 Replication-associated recombination protein A [Corynebacterium guangdongense]
MAQDALFDAGGGGEFRAEGAVSADDQVGARGTSFFAHGPGAPLAARMRPRSLDEIVGQDHLLGEGKPLRRLVEGSGEASVILYGPPGTGKTTVASLIAAAMGQNFVGLSALNSGVKQVRAVIDRARRDLIEGKRTVLFIDEVHRFSKTQQDALLGAVENRTVLLVAATTENPSFSVVSPLLSRSLLLQLVSLEPEGLRTVLRRAIEDKRGLDNRIRVSEDAIEQIVLLAGGDARRSLTYLEAAAEAVEDGGELTLETVRNNVNRAVVRYDRDGDQHYDVISAFIKSIRGSDVDAALHYLARMIEAGEDPRFIARRLVVHASEDIGMADPTALQSAVAAAEAVQFIGMPEGRLALAQATVHLATAPKSNAVYMAINKAQADVQAGRLGPVPPHLRDGHYEGATRVGSAVGYRYPHDDPRGVLAQQYLPDELADAVYYQPTDHGQESRISQFLGRLRGIVRGRG